jgi:hypothetical protein
MSDPWARDMRCDAVAGGAFGACSEDRVTIWHGMDTPARACGRHATYHTIYVFRGHAMLVES